VLARLRSALHSLGVALFPPACGACGRSLASFPAVGLCEPCEEGLLPNGGGRCARCDLPGASLCPRCEVEPPLFERLRAPFIYGGAIGELVVLAKFRRREDVAAALGRLVCRDASVVAAARECDAIVPVPLGPRRRRQRGYNQSAVLARAIAAVAAKPVLHGLERTRETLPQSELPLGRRGENVAGAFAATQKLPASILLVDDVVTSGETVRQAAAALLAGGALRIVVAAVARAT
jgi:ComF family protein